MSCNCSYVVNRWNPCCCQVGITTTSSTTTTTTCANGEPCKVAIDPRCVIYHGPDIPCYGIYSGDTAAHIFHIIVENLKCYGISTTTSTTSTSTTSTSTTSTSTTSTSSTSTTSTSSTSTTSTSTTTTTTVPTTSTTSTSTTSTTSTSTSSTTSTTSSTTSTTSTTSTSTTSTSTTSTTSTSTTTTTTLGPALGARYYVSSSTGNNTNDGLSELTPWASLAGVNGKMGIIQPGDEILFKRGDTFSGTLTITKSGTASLPITFGAYGTGNKPLFSGTGAKIDYLIYASGRNYVIIDGINITDPTFPSDPTRAIISRIQAGIQIDNCTNWIVRNCEMSLVGTGVYTALGGNHTITNNTIFNLRMIKNNGGGDYGANPVTISSNNNTITHNTFYGAWALSVDFGYDGGAIEFYDIGGGASNNFVGYNLMYDNNGISETGGSVTTPVCNNNIFVYNKMINNRDVFYLHGSHTGWKFYNNVVIETTNTRLSPTYTMSGDSGKTTSMDIKNNVFQIGIGGGVLAITLGRISGTHTNNIYKISGGTTLGFTLSTNEVNTTSAIFTDTVDSNPVNWDYTPVPGGLLVDTGINVGYTPDFDGNTVSTPPNIGIIDTNPIVPLSFSLTFTGTSISQSSFMYTGSSTQMTVKWGDGVIETLPNSGVEFGNTVFDLSHTYSTGGSHTITIVPQNILDVKGISVVGGNLTAVDFTNCTNLDFTDLSTNSLTSLNISSNTLLTNMYCTGNQLTSLNISNNPLLFFLDARSNKLTSTAINSILANIVAFGQPFGYAYLQTQTPAAPPTGQGITDSTNLNTGGWVVTTD